METCVLIPREFSLALATDHDRNSCSEIFKTEARSFSADVRISVWSNVFIPSETLIYPFQGSIRFDKIDLYSLLDDNDVNILYSYLTFKIFICHFFL
ncbi:GSCOCG00009306001-RA-CDS, partial [Cotesia congregata]